jgi:pimeloyl-[acyl-carrier protein] methyl ester esterase
MHIQIRGAGPPLVLIHGWGMHAGVFDGLAERLSTRHTLHLVDLPGHGRSRSDAIPLTLDACVDAIAADTPSAPWLGWSLGGLLALHAAARIPAQATALVMLCALPCFVRSPDWPYAVDADVFQQFASNLAHDHRATLERFLALETLGSEHAAVELRLLRSQVFVHGEPLPQALVDGLRLLECSDLRATLPQLRVSSLWIAGRRDRLSDWRAMQAAAALAPHRDVQVSRAHDAQERPPQAHYLRIEGAAHAPFLTHADEVAAAILDFLDASAMPPADRRNVEKKATDRA